MVSINAAYMLIAMGNTYGNLSELKALGFQFQNGQRTWELNLDNHPMNNPKQRKKLEARLTALEENGVRFVKYTSKGIES